MNRKIFITIIVVAILTIFFFPKDSSYSANPTIKQNECFGIEVVGSVMVGATHATCFGWVYEK